MHTYSKMRSGALLLMIALLMLVSCNKDLEQITGPAPITPSGLKLGETIAANDNDSLYYLLVKRGGLLNSINNPATTFTMFVPDNNAMRIFINAISGGAVPVNAPDAVFAGFINTNIDVASANAIVSYNIVPQAIRTSDIPADFPNWQYPTILNPAPTLSDLLRLATFPTTNNGGWINNIPLTSTNVSASNGVIHHEAFVVTPPSRFLWDRINTDPNLTYLKAAVQRADSGIVPNPASPNTLALALQSIGANLTVFAPTDAAFRTTLTGFIYQALLPIFINQLTALYISQGMSPAAAAAQAAIDAPPLALAQATSLASTPAVFSNPNLYPFLTAETVKGVVAYHVLGSRAFTNNLPTTETLVPTLLNGAVPIHPGVSIVANFGAPFVTSATVKGLGNTTPSNIIINASPLLPDPVGTSDQHYVNGVLHKIDQVLLPQ